MKKCFALSVVLAAGLQAGAATNGWPFAILRSYGSYEENRRFTERVFAAQERHPGLIEEIWFAGDGGLDTPAEERGRLAGEKNLGARERCRKLGIAFSYQQGVTLNHVADDIPRPGVPEDVWRVTAEGKVRYGLFCCTSPYVKDYSRATAKAIMSALRPVSYWTDDDLRLSSGGWPAGCFCPRCLKLFGERTGRSWDREALVAKLKGDAPDAAVRAAWCAFNGDMLIEYAKVFREAADAVSPEIRVCEQGPWSGSSGDGENMRQGVLAAFAGGNGTGIRPGGGYYIDRNSFDLLEKIAATSHEAARVSRLGYVRQICYEAENWPHIGGLKSPGGMMSECAYALANGCDSLALFWGADINGEPLESYDFFFDTFAAWKPHLLALRDAFRGTQPCGLAHHFGAGRLATKWWSDGFDARAVSALARNGLPMADARAEPDAWFLNAKSVESLRREDLAAVFSRPVLIDVAAYARLVERFPALGFAKKVELAEPPKETALPTDVRFAGYERFAQQGRCEGIRKFIRPKSKDVTAFSAMTAEAGSCGTCVIPTEFGGKVVLVQDAAFLGPDWHGPIWSWAGCRRHGILDALDSAVPGGMPVRLLTDGYACVVVARKAADGRTAGAFVLNIGTGETPPLELAIRRGAAKSWTLGLPKRPLSPAVCVRATADETVLWLPSLPAFGVAFVAPAEGQ